MRRTRIALVAVIASTLLLSGCIGPFQLYGPYPKTIDTMFDVTFSQSQAVPDFDDAEYHLDDEETLEAFRQLLRDHDIEPWNYTPADNAGCTGGITTKVHSLYYGAGDSDMTIDGCGAEDDSFEGEATALFSGYRETNAVPGFANFDIVALTFSQSQAVEGFDDAEYTQDERQQITRFRELLEQDGVIWSKGVDPELAGEPCPGAITTEITAVYRSTDVVVGPVAIGGCSDLAFADSITALFAEWRESLAS